MPTSNDTRFGAPLDLNGKVFTRLTVIGFSHKEVGVWLWKCQCSCGNTPIVAACQLNSGTRKSCGCINREIRAAKSDPKRFFTSFAKTDGCWEWQGERSEEGYGRFTISGKHWMAHRYAWTLENGPIQKGVLILHKCDNPCCVRVSHLFDGNVLRNVHDKLSKERENVPEGEVCKLSKLTRDQVEEIRERLKTGESQSSIAKDFPIKQQNVSAIKRGVSWNFKQAEKRSRVPLVPTKVDD